MKDKVRKGSFGPQFGVTPGGKSIEGGIHLHCVKVLGIELEPLLSGLQVRGIEGLALYQGLIGPGTGAYPYLSQGCSPLASMIPPLDQGVDLGDAQEIADQASRSRAPARI